MNNSEVVKSIIARYNKFPEDLNYLSKKEIQLAIDYIKEGTCKNINNVLLALEKEQINIPLEEDNTLLSIQEEYNIDGKIYKTNNSNENVSPESVTPGFLGFHLDYTKGIIENRSYCHIIRINGKHVTANLIHNRIKLGDGSIFSIMYIADVCVSSNYRGQGIGKDIESIIQTISKENNVDCIVSELMVEGGKEFQKNMENSKRRNGYSVNPYIGGANCMKALTKKGQELAKEVMNKKD